MAAPLHIRDIGQARKSALEAEAASAGVSVAEMVRDWIDAGLAKAKADRDRAAWIAAAKPGLADEARMLEQNGPSLSRYRTF